MQIKLLLLCAVAIARATDYTLFYTAYTDNHCGAVDSSQTGQIFAYTCAPEFYNARSGKITYIDETYLTSCDYTDTGCADLKLCQNYTRDQCYNSGDVQFSNKYSYTMADGKYTITYTNYNAKDCAGAAVVTSTIYPETCGREYNNERSGMITYIDGNMLTSCDYSDTACKNLILCENYTNYQCYGSSVTAFSNKYSWTPSSGTPAPSSAPHTWDSSDMSPTAPPTGSNDAAEFRIAYVSYSDNTCNDVNYQMSGEIFAYKCAPEYRKAPSSGKIVFINMDYLISCDYNDLECSDLRLCDNYTNAICYDSGADTDFSNKYSWSANSDGTFNINYAAYTAKGCSASNIDASQSGQIFESKCSLEYTAKPQSGMITFINDEYLTSCDYSDTQCKDLILCQNYNNTQCNASPVTAFSDRYAWERNSAVSLAAGLLFVFAAAFAML